MITKLAPRQYFWIVLLILLVACAPTLGSFPTEISPSPTKAIQTPTIAPTDTPPLFPLTIYPKFPFDGYVLLFTQDGHLFFQEGDSMPTKIFDIYEKAYHLELSDDNQKAILFRGDDDVYSINTNGTQGKIIIPKNWLDNFEKGTKMSIVQLLTATHRMLVKTFLCNSQEQSHLCMVSLFQVDTDTGEIRKLVDLGLAYQQNGHDQNIKVSPNEKMIAVGTADGTDILTLDGRIIRENVLPYKPSTPSEILPSLFWMPDSSGLILATPDALYNTPAYYGFTAYTIWRYSIESGNKIQVMLDPPLMGNEFDISPNGTWSIYGGLSYYDTALYLGNLETGHVTVIGDEITPFFSWGPDSKYFAYGTSLQHLNVVDDPSYSTEICSLMKWVDANHFLCTLVEGNRSRLYMAEIDDRAIKIFELGLDLSANFSIFIKPK